MAPPSPLLSHFHIKVFRASTISLISQKPSKIFTSNLICVFPTIKAICGIKFDNSVSNISWIMGPVILRKFSTFWVHIKVLRAPTISSISQQLSKIFTWNFRCVFPNIKAMFRIKVDNSVSNIECIMAPVLLRYFYAPTLLREAFRFALVRASVRACVPACVRLSVRPTWKLCRAYLQQY